MTRSEAEPKRWKAIEFLQHIGKTEDAERFAAMSLAGRAAVGEPEAGFGGGADTPDRGDAHPGADAGAGRREAIAEPAPDALAQALDLAREAAAHIIAQFGTTLDNVARRKVSRAFDRALIPRDKRRRGRKRDARITAAVQDYEAGMRGHQLYVKHITGYSGMGRYRREHAQRRLNEAIRSRSRRDHTTAA